MPLVSNIYLLPDCTTASIALNLEFPFFIAVSAMECSLAKSSSPSSVRKHRLTFCFTIRMPFLNLSNSSSKCGKLSPKRFFILVFSTFIFLCVIVLFRLRSMACASRWINLRDQSCFASSSLRYSAFAVSWLMLYDSVWRTNRLQSASLVFWLSTTWLSTRLTQ